MDKISIGKSVVLKTSKYLEFDPIKKDGFSIAFVPVAYLYGSGIYQIRNMINGESYIGATKNFLNRFKQHKATLSCGSCKHPKLIEAVKKFNLVNFEFIILEHVSLEKLTTREQYYIDLLKPTYNTHLNDASSALGVKRSPETLERMRQSGLGIKHPAWRRELKSRVQTGVKTGPRNDQSRKNMSEAQKNLYKNGYQHPNKRAVIQYNQDMEIVLEHESITAAAKYLNVENGAVGACARGKTKTCKGFIFKFKNPIK